jgi:hypothetical protein
MERVTIEDGTTWPDPSGKDYRDINWRLRYGHGSLSAGDLMNAAEIIEAYSALILHPAFTLKTVQAKVSSIRKSVNRRRGK